MRRQLLKADTEGLIHSDFQKAIPALRETELYKYFYRMPKGRLFHAHIEATYDIAYAVELAMESDDAYVYLWDTTSSYVYGQMAYRQWFENGEIPCGWKPIKEAAAERPNFKEELVSLCTTDMSKVGPEIWPHFENIFDRTKALVCYRPQFVKILEKAMLDMAAEGLSGVDFRFIGQLIFDENGHRYSLDENIALYHQIYEKVLEKYPDFSMRMIYAGYKGTDQEVVAASVEKAVEMARQYPGFVIGFDLVGCEDCDRNLEYYAPVFRKYDIPIIMHAGESVQDWNRNVAIAAELGYDRIGHGLNSYMFPDAVEDMKKRQVMLEVCPLSNQLLGYVADLRQHPAAQYVKQGLNVSISSDDCAFFKTNYITDDLVAAYLNWDLSLKDIKRIVAPR
ncbi:MAG: hypothetical protein HUJ91_03095 [Bacteroidales bacterium]|nr:hypothetical protein [Bacteroidales bacterium]